MKNFISIKELKDSQKSTKIKNKTISKQGMFNILNNFLKNNSKPIKENGIIKGYDLFVTLKIMFYKSKKHKTGNIPIHFAFLNLVNYIKENKLIERICEKKEKFNYYLESFPKPKYQRKFWKTYYNVKKFLFSYKRLYNYDKTLYNLLKEKNRKFANLLSKKENSNLSKEEKEEIKELEKFLFQEVKRLRSENGLV